MRRFEGRTVLVTGGNRGIGLAIAGRFAEEEANLVIASNDDAVMDAAETLPGAALGVVCDVSRPAEVRALYDAAAARFGGVDVSVQNAGIITIARIEDLTEADWDATLDVNAKGVFLSRQQALRRMRAQGRGGRLINMASGQARQGFIFTPHHAASKFGVLGVTQSLAKELATEGTTVNAVCPGIIDTDMWAYNDRVWGRMLGDYAPGELMAEWMRNIPMRRAGSGADVAGVVASLASADAASVTGQTLNVDGGPIMS